MIGRAKPNVQVSVDVVTSGSISIESWDELLLPRFEASQPLHRRELWTVGGVVLLPFRWTKRRTAEWGAEDKS